jgi:hypothetical protein
MCTKEKEEGRSCREGAALPGSIGFERERPQARRIPTRNCGGLAA